MSWTNFRKSTVLSVTAGVTIFALWNIWRVFRRRDVGGKRRRRDASSYIKDKSIHIVSTTEEWELVYPKLMQGLRCKKVLGLDCEWVGKNKVALLQLCNSLGLCVLVRLSMMKQAFPESLLLLLGDKNILKTGVAVVNDGKKLHLDYGFPVAGCVDLRQILERVRGVFDCRSRGLKGLSSGILSVEISKDLDIRCGDWEADHYSQAQIDYAATDAAVAVDIFTELVFAKIASSNQERTDSSSLQLKIDSSCNYAHNNGDSMTDISATDEDVSTELEDKFWRMACSLCQGIVDKGYSFNPKNGTGVC